MQFTAFDSFVFRSIFIETHLSSPTRETAQAWETQLLELEKTQSARASATTSTRACWA